MRPIIKGLKQIAGFLLVAIVASSVFAQDILHSPRIRNDQRVLRCSSSRVLRRSENYALLTSMTKPYTKI